ncbi:MAG: hypothetical protein DWP97_03025 [Calditrichaeota bacterium]|nr:MAG: hypothetical protein DWP97_03025 [Calditrichota bacterium]
MKMKNIQTIFSYIIFLFIVSSASAVELAEEPIQSRLQSNILFADESWEIGDSKTEENTKSDDIQYSSQTKKYSLGKAVLYSALLPGLGQRYVGKSTKSKVYFASEALTWAGYAAFSLMGKWKKDDLIDYAAVHASAQLEGKDDQFLDYVGFYNSLDEFNTLGRVTDRDREYYQSTAEFYWQWDSATNRETYKDIKNSSKEAYRRADFMIVIAIVNRLVSVIDVVRDVRSENKKVATNISSVEEKKYKLSINPLSNTTQVKLTIYPSF